MKKAILSVLLLLSIFSLQAESVRGNAADRIDLSDNDQISKEYELGIDQLVFISPGAKTDFLEGFEISIRVPAPLQQFGDNFLFMIYGKMSPEPELGKTRNYQGIEKGHRILSSRARQYIEFSVSDETVSGTTLLYGEDFPMAVMISPMSKGIPQAVESNPFKIRITPKWKDIGSIVLISEVASLESLELWIDGKRVNYTGQEIITDSGIHNLRARLDGFYELNQNFVVKQAEQNRVELPFQSEKSNIKFTAPEGVDIFFDGEKLDFPLENTFESDKGDHIVVFKLGGYQISKQFSLIPGKDYEISLFLDILVEEN